MRSARRRICERSRAEPHTRSQPNSSCINRSLSFIFLVVNRPRPAWAYGEPSASRSPPKPPSAGRGPPSPLTRRAADGRRTAGAACLQRAVRSTTSRLERTYIKHVHAALLHYIRTRTYRFWHALWPTSMAHASRRLRNASPLDLASTSSRSRRLRNASPLDLASTSSRSASRSRPSTRVRLTAKPLPPLPWLERASTK